MVILDSVKDIVVKFTKNNLKLAIAEFLNNISFANFTQVQSLAFNNLCENIATSESASCNLI